MASCASVALADRPRPELLPEPLQAATDSTWSSPPAGPDDAVRDDAVTLSAAPNSAPPEPDPDAPLQQPMPESDTRMAEPVTPPPVYVATYTARASVGRGTTTMSLLPAGDGQFRAYSETKARGLARLIRGEPILECSVFSVGGDGQWYAQDYAFRDGRKDADIAFDWETLVADVRYQSEQKTLSLEGMIGDRVLEQLQVSQLLRNDEQPGEFRIIDRGNLVTINYAALGVGETKTDYGTFETHQYRRSREGSKRSSLIWFAPALNWLPVRIEQYRLDKRQASAELKSLELGEAVQARGTVTPVCP
ncbi:MAG: DUF3108 domain-containing protein [Pseudomonadota bacterium]